MKTIVHFYDAATGLLSGRTFSAGGADFDAALAANTPPGHKAIEGLFDHLSQRVDIETGAVVDYQPPRPTADHEWNAATKRWQLTADAAEAIANDTAARDAINQHEATSLRAMREALLATLPANSPLRLRLQQTDDAISAARRGLKK